MPGMITQRAFFHFSPILNLKLELPPYFHIRRLCPLHPEFRKNGVINSNHIDEIRHWPQFLHNTLRFNHMHGTNRNDYENRGESLISD